MGEDTTITLAGDNPVENVITWLRELGVPSTRTAD